MNNIHIGNILILFPLNTLKGIKGMEIRLVWASLTPSTTAWYRKVLPSMHQSGRITYNVHLGHTYIHQTQHHGLMLFSLSLSKHYLLSIRCRFYVTYLWSLKKWEYKIYIIRVRFQGKCGEEYIQTDSEKYSKVKIHPVQCPVKYTPSLNRHICNNTLIHIINYLLALFTAKRVKSAFDRIITQI